MAATAARRRRLQHAEARSALQEDVDHDQIAAVLRVGQPRQRAHLVLGGADDVDRRHLLERGDQVLADDRTVLDDERFQLGHRTARCAMPHVTGGWPSCRVGEGCASAELAEGLAATADGCKGWARFSNTEAPSVGQGAGANKPRSAHRPVGDFLRAVGVCIALVVLCAVARRSAAPPSRRRWSSARSGSPSRTSSARSWPRRWPAPAGRPMHKPGLGNTGILEQALAERRGRPLPGVHRNDRSRAAQARRQSLARRAEPLARAARAEGRDPVRLQQHLCAGDDPRRRPTRSASRRISDLFKPAAAALDARPLARVPAARRRLAGAAQGAYGARAGEPIGLDHGLAYDAVAAGRVDVIDVYSTDAKLGRSA